MIKADLIQALLSVRTLTFIVRRLFKGENLTLSLIHSFGQMKDLTHQVTSATQIIAEIKKSCKQFNTYHDVYITTSDVIEGVILTTTS